MKHFLLAICLIISTAESVNAQLELPNRSFERWYSVGGLYDSLGQWTSNNTASFTGIRKDSVKKYDSAYSLQVLQNGWARSTPVRSAPLGILFNYTSRISAGDKVTIRVIAIKTGTAYDSSDLYMRNSFPNWTHTGRHYSFSSHPEYLQFVIIGGQDSATTFNIDRARFEVEGVENISRKIKPLLAPNPMNKQAVLSFINPHRASYRLVLTDAIGKTVSVKEGIREERIIIERNSLPPGLYLWQLWSETSGGRATGSVTIE